jgi:hypothetical protein
VNISPLTVGIAEREHYDDDMTHLSVQASLTLLKEHIARKVGNGTSVREIEDLLRYTGNGSRREQSESLLSDEQRQLIRRQREPLPGNATPFYVRFGCEMSPLLNRDLLSTIVFSVHLVKRIAGKPSKLMAQRTHQNHLIGETL